MVRPSPPVVVLGIALVLAAAVGLFIAYSKRSSADLAFWFEPISDEARKTVPERLAGGISADDMNIIEAKAREEIVRAFREYPIAVVGRAAALYHVRVVDSLNSPRGGSAESHVFPGLGGQGFINFRSHAHGAITYAPPDADRQEIVAAIGRGIGRAAVHEFTHQLLGRQAPIDDSKDIQSYEYGSAIRREQYYGEMRWDIAAPMLKGKFGLQ
jgi:hypothetical protein